MIVFLIYLLLFLWLINRNGFFDIASDSVVSKKLFALLFLLKAMAVPAFYFIYTKMYGGIEQLDAGKFYHDATLIGDYAFRDPLAYLRLLFGFQNDNEGSADYVNFLQYTFNWDNGEFKDYMYNDNRVVIRLHSFLHFFSFGSYFAQALFNCLLSFIGIVFIYKSIKEFFEGREFFILLILCLFPALWFYTGAVLKEGLAMFIIGCQVHGLKSVIYGDSKLSQKFVAGLFFVAGFFLKPYLLLFCMLCFALFFYLQNNSKIKFKTTVFFLIFSGLFISANYASLLVKKKSIFTAISNHQRVFADVAEGGIFLQHDSKFVRLKYDYNLVTKIGSNDSLFKIKPKVAYMYWDLNKAADTLYCTSNADTSNIYKMQYVISHSNSNLNIGAPSDGFTSTLLHGFYNSLFHPFFINAKGPLQLLASFENLLLLLSFVILILTVIRTKKINFLPLVFVFIALALCLLTGIATPNSGAIFRYRSPVVIYILLATLYCWPMVFSKKNHLNKTS